MEQEDRDDCVSANAYVRLYVNEVPCNVASKVSMLATKLPVVACGLLQHESKMSVLHFRYIFFLLFGRLILFVCDHM